MANNLKQYIISSQQVRLIQNYTDLSSQTFGNAYQSAIRAGYSPSYARNVTSRYLIRGMLPELAQLAKDYAWLLNEPSEEEKRYIEKLESQNP